MQRNLFNYLKKIFGKDKYLDLEKFLNVILYDKKYGFYNTIDKTNGELIGNKGHFITGPEISQLFGELIGVWVLELCKNNKFKNINLIELGPGKGTLMSDVLRVLSRQNKSLKITIHLLEFSDKLKSFQTETLKKFNFSVLWYKDIFKLKYKLNNNPTIIISNEFFDCLPINQFKFYKSKNKFTKVIIKLNENKFSFDEKLLKDQEVPIICKNLTKNPDNLKDETIIEYSGLISSYVDEICKIILNNNGANLIIDYGKENPFGSTIQSVYKNQKSNFFDHIGQSDYSSLVDFKNIKNIVEGNNLLFYSLKTQKDFLIDMGINNRIENLSLKSTILERRELMSGYERLISKRQMGEIFKVNCFAKKNVVVPIFKV